MQNDKRLVRYSLLLAALWPLLLGFADKVPFGLPLLWPEEQRAFLQDGPGLLLSQGEIDELLGLDVVDREGFIVRYLSRDLDPSTPDNELAEGIRRRRALVRDELMNFLDDRAKLLFLNGAPQTRKVIDCAETYKPIELWTYSHRDETQQLVLYRPKQDVPWRLWLPIDSKRVLYNAEMEYWLEQWEEMRRSLIGGKRFDLQICDYAEEIDLATGVDGLFGFQPERPKNLELQAYMQPPDDLASWARRAAATAEVEGPGQLGPAELELFFPERQGLRLLTSAMIKLEPDAALEPFVEGDKAELRFVVEGHLERDAKVFESFRMRFQLPFDDTADVPLALMVNRPLRPNQEFLMRLKLVEETSGRELYLNRGFVVPREPTPMDAPPLADEVIVSIGEELAKQRIEGYDSLILVPPETDVIFGLWRAETLVTGSRIIKVAFYLDGELVMTRRRPPFTAEMRLATYPTEQIVRVEGFDEAGEKVASDEVILNQPRGELRVRILEPVRGETVVSGDVTVRVEVVVPEEKRVVAVNFLLNDELLATKKKPPWEAVIEVPPTGALTYLNVTAELDDGARAEAVRFLNAPNYMEEVDVNLVELYTTVADKSGRLVRGLTADDFQISEDGRPQQVAKFELVENLPLTLGVTIDTSGSMWESLGEAQRAAIDFLENIITPRDRCFALAFSDRPTLLMERTSDVGAVAAKVQDLVASGSTSLHDAIVTSLYYYRGIRGRRALVLLSDGDDTSSTLDFAEALEYARRSGVSVYTIGLNVSKLQVSVRRKLETLATETGGRTFYIREAAELFTVYDEIEEELRSQYLVAYNSDRVATDQSAKDKDEYREVDVKVKGGKLKARTISGYYP